MKKSGFTLLEILVSVGILATVAILITQVLFTTTHVNKKTVILADIKQNGNFTLDVVSRMVRSAARIETSCDGTVTTPSAQIRNADDTVTVLTCVSDGTVARIASVSGTGTVSYLSGGTVTLSASGRSDCSDSSLQFSCPPTSGIPRQMTITFTLGQAGFSGSAYENGSASFSGTIGLRN